MYGVYTNVKHNYLILMKFYQLRSMKDFKASKITYFIWKVMNQHKLKLIYSSEDISNANILLIYAVKYSRNACNYAVGRLDVCVETS